MKDLIEALQEYDKIHLPRWEELPDFDVYMDQLITLVNRYLFFLQEENNPIITPAMVNNYVKLNLMPKPIKKKYQRIHIAYLIAITLLKQVITISQISDGIDLQVKTSGLKGAYNLFCEEIEESIHCVVVSFTSAQDPLLSFPHFTNENSATKLATISLITKLLCIQFLNRKNKSVKKDRKQ